MSLATGNDKVILLSPFSQPSTPHTVNHVPFKYIQSQKEIVLENRKLHHRNLNQFYPKQKNDKWNCHFPDTIRYLEIGKNSTYSAKLQNEKDTSNSVTPGNIHDFNRFVHDSPRIILKISDHQNPRKTHQPYHLQHYTVKRNN